VERQGVIDRLLEHYQHPRNNGVLADADVIVAGGQPDCGDQVTVFLRIDDRQAIAQMHFTGHGCTISQAAASILTELVPGMTVADVLRLDDEWMLSVLGRDVVHNRARCATLALSTLQNALLRWQTERRAAGEPCVP
jgi:nitrogen fixation NifU-like protein